MKPPQVTLKNVLLRYGPVTILKEVSLEVSAGRIAAVVGMTGVGKTTILKLVAGLIAPTQGAVLLDTEHAVLARQSVRVAYVFQQPTLIPWLTALQNVLLPCRLRGDAVDSSLAEHWLAQVQAGAIRHQYPHELSGGQAMRVSLARALIQRPAVLLLDEPFAALDTVTRRRMQGLILDLHHQQPCTVLLVTHEVPEAVSLSDQLCVLAGQGGATVVHREQYQWPVPRPERFASQPEVIQAVESLLTTLAVQSGVA